MSSGLRPVMILAGGTGGHVYPALAVAQWLRRAGVPVVWMGTRKGLEARVVPEAGIPIDWLSVSGLRGKGVLAWLLAPLRLNIAITQALGIMLRRRPRAVLGMGGFVAGPGGLVAFLLARPLVIHEQNAIAGLTNRLLAPLCERLLEGFPGTFSSAKAQCTGNPVREDIAALAPPGQRMAGRGARLRLLVLGGSLGAKALNEVVPQAVRRLPEPQRPEVRHQAGRLHLEDTLRAYAEAGVQGQVQAYMEDMAAHYAWADLVLCRAGAITVAELAAAGVGAILVPYPHAVDDHQRANARFLSEAGAAVLVDQSELSAGRLGRLLGDLGGDRERLLAMARAARDQARPEALETVGRICLEVAGPATSAGAQGR